MNSLFGETGQFGQSVLLIVKMEASRQDAGIVRHCQTFLVMDQTLIWNLATRMSNVKVIWICVCVCFLLFWVCAYMCVWHVGSMASVNLIYSNPAPSDLKGNPYDVCEYFHQQSGSYGETGDPAQWAVMRGWEQGAECAQLWARMSAVWGRLLVLSLVPSCLVG